LVGVGEEPIFMNGIEIIIPVKNESQNVKVLAERIDNAMNRAKLPYGMIFVDDGSTDDTIRQIEALKTRYPIKLHRRLGRPGKAFCILQGAQLATADYLVMIDGDLQYPPEAISEMVSQTPQHGVVVANRTVYTSTRLRRVASRLNALVFGRLLFGLRCDVQSGLKLVRREIFEHIDRTLIKPWSLDIPLLYTALELGYTIGGVPISFERRKNGESKVSFMKTAVEIASGALKLKLQRKRLYQLSPGVQGSMLGAGVVRRRRRFITHTTLPHQRSALVTLKLWQKLFTATLLTTLAVGLFLNSRTTAVIAIGILSSIYFIDVLFNLYLVLKSLGTTAEITSTVDELEILDPQSLPVYSILCPLFREAHMLPQFVNAINKLDWPKDKLDVQLLLEEEDRETIAAAQKMDLPSFIRVTVVPHSLPKTKPKACNYGLGMARGEYIVIYDAEDIPDPLQLKKAYHGFSKVDEKVLCLQAKLDYYNPHQNLLTRFFAAEYSLWFELMLTGLQSIGTTIPLGGTSNHFRTDNLRRLHGWDPFNVTEDCDLGVRLFREGYRTAIIDSTTHEEANSSVRNWLRQRSRWIKGYLQTYFVHMRDPFTFVEERGIHALIFQLVMGAKVVFMLINPILWAATISYFALYSLVGPTIESLYPTVVFYMAVISLVFGNFMYLYEYMIGAAKRGHWPVVKYVFLVPAYWLLLSTGAAIAVGQLITNPHYWEKTHHGFHIEKEEARKRREQLREQAREARAQRLQRIRSLASSGIATGGTLVAASLVGNFLNFLYNAYLGRAIDIAQFGLVSLLGSFWYLSQIPLGALQRTVVHRSAYLLGNYKTPIKEFWLSVRGSSVNLSLMGAGLWLISIPLLVKFFQAETLLPFVLFSPVWIIGTVYMVDRGFLSGSLKFVTLAVLVIAESLSRLLISVALVELGLAQWVYAAVPVSLLIAFLISGFAIRRIKVKPVPADSGELVRFPKRFFVTSILAGLSTIAFLSFDLMLAKHYLPPEQAGEYALLSLAGKMIFFFGSLFSQFVNPLVSRAVGAKEDSTRLFSRFVLLTMGVSVAVFLAVGVFGSTSIPVLLGPAAGPILPFLPVYGLAMVNFTIAASIILYHQARREYLFSYVSFLLTLAQVGGIVLFHDGIGQVSKVMLAAGTAYLVVMALLHLIYERLLSLTKNIGDFFGLFSGLPKQPSIVPKLRILVFNWRDTKHVWAGGAEVYIHELAKRWVKDGNKVTVFCGNDGHAPRNEVVDGVQIVRRGGFYTVYIWAFLYYVLRFRGLFDVVVDSENGIPFFTPLFVRVPKYLMIHHVHQDVFREHLRVPLSWIAMFMESRLMPLIYRSQKIITSSESSRKAIAHLGLSKASDIEVVEPGVEPGLFGKQTKTAYPSFLYLGRLKPYKNVDVLVRAFAKVHRRRPLARLTIAGEGESLKSIKELVSDLGLNREVSLLGKVSQGKKARLMAESWAAVQPSSVEGWGITVVEANASGTPVIASNVNGLKDSVVDGVTGILVPVKSVRAFADAMDYLASTPEYRKSLTNAAYHWSKRFSWDKSAGLFYRILVENMGAELEYQAVGRIAVANYKK